MFLACAWMLLGLVLAGIGGEVFLKGAVGLARVARLPTSVIGLTVAAFATSGPELSVAVSSALAGTPSISLGDALGSNVVNVALILGVSLLISETRINTQGSKRDIPAAIFQPILLIILAMDGLLSRIDAAIMLTFFTLWLVSIVLEVKKFRAETAENVLPEVGLSRQLMFAIVGIFILVLSGQSIVHGAEQLGDVLGISPFIIGATLVAFGTSAPELATTVISKIRGHGDVGLGTVLGSNIFNGLFIVSVAALIHPIRIEFSTVQLSLAFGLISVFLLVPPKSAVFTRLRGLSLLAVYVSYVLFTILS